MHSTVNDAAELDFIGGQAVDVESGRGDRKGSVSRKFVVSRDPFSLKLPKLS